MYFLIGKRCGNVNWARRQTCNMCNAPKFGDLEERTGYGGGFNEREGVEYIQREESDDEYDEFGRKKKKFRNKTQSTSSDKKVCLHYYLSEIVCCFLECTLYQLENTIQSDTDFFPICNALKNIRRFCPSTALP